MVNLNMTLKRLALLLPILLTTAALAAGNPVSVVSNSLEVTVAVKANVDAFTATVVGGELSVTADPATNTIQSAVYSFDWAGVKTGKDKRDQEMLEWAEAETHPKGVFTLTAIETRPAGTVAKGTLEFHGVTREIEFPVAIAASGAGFKVSGTATIDHRDWGLKQIRKFAIFTVNPIVTVSFKFETTGQA